MELERIALNDPYFIEKNSILTSISTRALFLKALGIPIKYVYGHFRYCTYYRLDCSLE